MEFVDSWGNYIPITLCHKEVIKGRREKIIIANPAIRDKIIQNILNFGEYIILLFYYNSSAG